MCRDTLNGSVPAPIKELFVADAGDYTTWLLCHSLIAAKTDPRGFQEGDVYRGQYPNKQDVRH